MHVAQAAGGPRGDGLGGDPLEASTARDPLLQPVQAKGAVREGAAIDAPGGPGAALPGPLQAKMESSFGRSFADVRVHQGSHVSEIGAQAFAKGPDLHFAPGRFQPESPAGQSLIGHELAHKVQQDAGRVTGPQGKGSPVVADAALEAEADAAGARAARGEPAGVEGVSSAGAQPKAADSPVQLKGEAGLALGELQSKGGEASGIGKFKAFFGKKDNYAAILKQLEKVAQRDTEEGPTPSMALNGTFVKAYQDLEDRIRGWMENHDKTDPRYEAMEFALKQVHDAWMLRKAEITGFHEGTDVNKGQGATDKGAVKQVSQVNYRTPQDQLKGFFLPEMGEQKSSAAVASGIPAINPNLGNRAIAFKRIDQLIGTGLIPRTEYASKEGYTGVVMATAEGEAPVKSVATRIEDKYEGEELEIVRRSMKSAFENPEDYGEMIKDKGWAKDEKGNYQIQTQAVMDIDFTDPTLQKGLANLQLLDAITGQVDRHDKNYFIDTDKNGRVVGVTGIDNDLSFGREFLDPDMFKKEAAKKTIAAERHDHTVGLPMIVDEAVGERILSIKPAQIESAIGELLSKDEVRATISRFEHVQKQVRELKSKGLLVKAWGKDTENKHGGEQNSYYDRLKSAAGGAGKFKPRRVG